MLPGTSMARLDPHPTILPPDPERYARGARFANDRRRAWQDLHHAWAMAIDALAAVARGLWGLLAAPVVLLAGILYALPGRGGSAVRERDGGSRTAPLPARGADAPSRATCPEEEVTGASTEVDIPRPDQRPTVVESTAAG